MSHIGEMKQLGNAETTIVPGGRRNALESFRSPDGQEYSIVSETVPEIVVARKEEGQRPKVVGLADMPYEMPTGSNDSDFQKLRYEFLNRFGLPKEATTTTSPTDTYVMGSGRLALLVDSNDPSIFSQGFLKGGTQFQLAFNSAIKNPPEYVTTVTQMKRELKSFPKKAVTAKIDGSTYSVKYLKKITNVFQKGEVQFYMMKELGKQIYPVAVSDMRGHFIILSPRGADSNETLPALFP